MKSNDQAIVRTYQDGMPRKENCRIIRVSTVNVDVQITYADGFTCTVSVDPSMVEAGE